jgi:leucyl-tRNA synthetase
MKMSKSKGNVIFMRDMNEKVGADLFRINMAASNEELNDADWRDESIAGYKAKLRFLLEVVKDLKKAKRKSMLTVDSYLISKMQEHIKNTTECYEAMKFRSASQSSLFNAVNDIKWYIERVGGIKNCNRKVLCDAVSSVVRMISPLTPHVCEEMWSRIGKGFVATAEWPCYDENVIDKNAMELEGILVKVVEDLKNVLKIVGKKKNAYLYVVTDKELEHIENGKDFIRKQLGFKKISVFKVSDAKKYDPQNKSAKAKYGKPGIFLE